MQLLSMLTEIQYFKISIRQCSIISPPVGEKSVIWLDMWKIQMVCPINWSIPQLTAISLKRRKPQYGLTYQIEGLFRLSWCLNEQLGQLALKRLFCSLRVNIFPLNYFSLMGGSNSIWVTSFVVILIRRGLTTE